MPSSCCAYNCTARFVKGGGVTFHKFPIDVEKQKVWLRNLRRKNFVPSKYSVICSKHFTQENFDRNKFGGTWLKKDAVPTLFDFPIHLLPRKRQRKPPRNQSFELPTLTTEESVTVEEDGPPTPKRRLTYIGDFTKKDLNSPTEAYKVLEIAKQKIALQRKELVATRKKSTRLIKKVADLKRIIKVLRQKCMLSDSALNVLQGTDLESAT